MAGAELTTLLERERLPPVRTALAYGSGALSQQGYGDSGSSGSSSSSENLLRAGAGAPMLDLILAVDDPRAWHRANLEVNAHHYAWLARTAGPARVAQFQTDLTAAVYYNTLVPMRGEGGGGGRGGGRLMKYGVVATRDLDEELRDWRWMYLAGRLHKPVLFSDHLLLDGGAGNRASTAADSGHDRPRARQGDLAGALRENLISALRMALLLLPASFDQMELYTTIAGLSYGGDFRMAFGENPDKVRNIVAPNLPRFDDLYRPLLEGHPDFAQTLALSPSAAYAPPQSRSEGRPAERQPPHWRCIQDVSLAPRRRLLQQLPAAIRPPAKVVSEISTEAGLAAASAAVAADLRALVARSSVRQSAKGIATAGAAKSTRYVAAKVGKFAGGWSKRFLGR